MEDSLSFPFWIYSETNATIVSRVPVSILKFKRWETLHFFGRVEMGVYRGSFETQGFQIYSSFEKSGHLEMFPVCATFRHHSGYIRAIDKKVSQKQEKKPTSKKLDDSILQKVLETCKKIVVESDEHVLILHHLSMIEDFVQNQLHPSQNLEGRHLIHNKLKIPGFYPFKLNDPKEKRREINAPIFIVPGQWNDVIDAIYQESKKEPPTILVSGPQNSGKSTFCKYAVNRLLNYYSEIVFLETDIGQPEMCVSGTVSIYTLSSPLLGPPWFNIQEPAKCFYYGDNQPKSDHHYYLNCIKLLIDHYQKNWKHLPLVINTCGFIQSYPFQVFLSTFTGSTAFLILVELCEYLKAKYILEIERSNIQNSLSNKESRIIEISAVKSDFIWKKKSKETRDVQILRYFLPTFHHRLCFQIPWTQLRMKFLFEAVPWSQSLYALNGTIVALCVEHSTIKIESQSERELASKYPVLLPTLHPFYGECLGIGIIWNIDTVERVFNIMTPLSANKVHKVNTIVRGNMNIPRDFFDKIEISERMPYFSFFTEGIHRVKFTPMPSSGKRQKINMNNPDEQLWAFKYVKEVPCQFHKADS